MKHLFLLLLVIISTNSFAGSAYMGNEREGYAIGPKRAAKMAKPYLYESYRLRTANAPETEDEFWKMDYLRTHVLLDGEYYLVVRSLPLKMSFQYEKHAVRIHIFTGEVELLK
ncbi:MAG: hypothetical protein ABW149_01705 [Sedimenticola sp.]